MTRSVAIFGGKQVDAEASLAKAKLPGDKSVRLPTAKLADELFPGKVAG